SLAMRESRVSSPSAANIGAWRRRWAVSLLRMFGDILFDVFHLRRPALIVHPEGFEPPSLGDVFEPRFGQGQQRPACGFLEPELDERRRFLRIIDLRVDAVRMPGK